MSRALRVKSAGPAMTVQDLGRTGTLALGLPRGGAADRTALAEAAALLGQPPGAAAVEMPGQGGTFEAQGDLRIALTGAAMQASIDGTAVRWPGSHALGDGQRLTIGAARGGVYGYLSVGGGIATESRLGSRSVHPAMGLGAYLVAGDVLPIGDDPGRTTGRTLSPEPRFEGGEVRVVAGPQTPLFDADTQARFEATAFSRDPRGNRQGARLSFEGDGFATADQLTILSDVIIPGDIQITGDGTPFVLLPDCQTTGGYPRIGTVVPDDLPRVAQAQPGRPLKFRFVDRAEALADFRRHRAAERDLGRKVQPIVRNPAEMSDLLSYQLVGGVTDGSQGEHE